MHHDKRDFILGIQDWFSIQKSIHIINSIYRLRKKKIKHIFSVEIVFNKIQHSFMIKILRKVGIEGNFLNLIRNNHRQYNKHYISF